MTYKEALENIKSSAVQLPSSNGPIARLPNSNSPVVNTEVNNIPPAAPAAGCKALDIHNRDVVTNAVKALGTLLRISIPAGTTVNIHNLLEVLSPTGISVDVRVPGFNGITAKGIRLPSLKTIVDAIKAVGGTVEILN